MNELNFCYTFKQPKIRKVVPLAKLHCLSLHICHTNLRGKMDLTRLNVMGLWWFNIYFWSLVLKNFTILVLEWREVDWDKRFQRDFAPFSMLNKKIGFTEVGILSLQWGISRKLASGSHFMPLMFSNKLKSKHLRTHAVCSASLNIIMRP